MWGSDLRLASFRDVSIQMAPTLGPKVCKYYLHWTSWIPKPYRPNIETPKPQKYVVRFFFGGLVPPTCDVQVGLDSRV